MTAAVHAGPRGGLGGGLLSAGATGRFPRGLESLQLIAPHEDFSPGPVRRQATVLDVPANAHHAEVQISSNLLDGQQLSLSHTPNGSQSDYQDNTYFERSGSVYSKYVFRKGVGVREIPLTQGMVALVDDEDYEWLSRHRWCARRDRRGSWYAMRGVRIGHRTVTVLMHGVLMGGTRVGKTADHKDRDGLNNQRDNLRWANRFEQQHNTGKRQANQSGFKGVYRHRRNPTWIAQISYHHQQIYLGSFKDPEAAAHAYDRKATELHGEFACLNFPTDI